MTVLFFCFFLPLEVYVVVALRESRVELSEQCKIWHPCEHIFHGLFVTDIPDLWYYAPINVNPVGGECGQGVGIWQILKFFDQIL